MRADVLPTATGVPRGHACVEDCKSAQMGSRFGDQGGDGAWSAVHVLFPRPRHDDLVPLKVHLGVYHSPLPRKQAGPEPLTVERRAVRS